MTKFAVTIATLALLGACSGSGTSTTARDEMGDDGTDAMGDDDDDDSTPGDDDDDSTPGDDDDDDDSQGDDDDDDDDSMPDDDDDDDSTDGTMGDDDDDDDVEPAVLEGNWLSEGEDVAPLLVELTNAVSITATFTADTFTVWTTDGDGQEVNQTGVYTAEPSGVGEIYDILLEQTTPQAITVEGIYEIDNSVSPPIMRYEVVQTSPSVGAEPPTADKGFGGTNLGDDLTQIFVRQ